MTFTQPFFGESYSKINKKTNARMLLPGVMQRSEMLISLQPRNPLQQWEGPEKGINEVFNRSQKAHLTSIVPASLEWTENWLNV